MLGLLSVDIFILLLWTFVDRPRGVTYESSAGGLYAPITLTVCSTTLSSPFEQAMVAWKAILLAAGVYKSICTWDMPSDIAEVSTISTYCALDYCIVRAKWVVVLQINLSACAFNVIAMMMQLLWNGQLSPPKDTRPSLSPASDSS